MQKKLKLIKTGYAVGYLLNDIKLVFDKETFDRFQKWMFGETVGIYKGDSLIYKYDFERFLSGKPPY